MAYWIAENRTYDIKFQGTWFFMATSVTRDSINGCFQQVKMIWMTECAQSNNMHTHDPSVKIS